MSSLISAQPYDPVFDAQKHYRAVLQCTARPGSIGQLDDTLLEVPSPLNRATAHILLMLLGGETSFFVDPPESAIVEFVRRHTSAPWAAPEQAEFLVLLDAHRLEPLRHASIGTLLYPDAGATVIVQVAALSPAPISGALRLLLTGPGIETETAAYVAGASSELFDLLRECNAEFPLGIDIYLTCDSLAAGPCVLALPRTTRIRWDL